jgi:PTH1 family peptidyl-tRNA hydrolase
MNRSGQVVATAAGFYRVPVEDIIVLADDMALEPGRIRIRSKGSSGGHKGLGDIVEKFGNEEFVRLRVGIGLSGVEAGESYVLGRATAEQRKLISAAVGKSVDAIVCWLSEGIEAAMNKYNARQDEAVAGNGE